MAARGPLRTERSRSCRSAPRWIGTLVVAAVLMPRPAAAAEVFAYGPKDPVRGHVVPGVPFEPWLGRNACGPACLAMLLNYWDPARAFRQAEIAAEAFDAANQVTRSSEMLLYPRNHGFEAWSFRGDLGILKDALRRNVPVIVLTRTIRQVPKGHYRVVIGFDDARGCIVFHDPFFGERRAMKTADFLKAWELGENRTASRWAMTAAPTAVEFPCPALREDPLTAINLATAFYRRGEFERSRAEWQAARAALPRDPMPVYGLAMISLRENRLDEAESEARRAVELDGGCAHAHDVLGLVQARRGRWLEALRTLGRAVRLSPREDFIRDHYLRVRDLYIQSARLAGNTKQGGAS